VLGLRQQLAGDGIGVAGVVGDHHQLARTGRRVDRHALHHQELRGRDVGVARADDAIDARHRRGAERHRRDGAAPPIANTRSTAAISAAASTSAAGVPEASGGEHSTISLTPAARAGTAPISTLLGYAARPPGA
jgi:hypothetical protein